MPVMLGSGVEGRTTSSFAAEILAIAESHFLLAEWPETHVLSLTTAESSLRWLHSETDPSSFADGRFGLD